MADAVEISTRMLANQQKYLNYFKIQTEGCSKLKDLSFIERPGFQLYAMQKAFKVGKDIYDMIRLHTDYAQEMEFNDLLNIFKEKEAGKVQVPI